MPSHELVSRALTLIGKHADNHDYFFSKPGTPDWIDPLAEAGLFQPLPHLQGDMICFPGPVTERLAESDQTEAAISLARSSTASHNFATSSPPPVGTCRVT